MILKLMITGIKLQDKKKF